MTVLSNLSSQTVAANGQVLLPTTSLQKGCNTTPTNNGISINKCGSYLVSATITGLVTGGGNINLAVQVNGQTVSYLQGEAYSNTGEPATITLSQPIYVNPNCCAVTNNIPAVVTLVNNGTNSDVLSNAVLSATKID